MPDGVDTRSGRGQLRFRALPVPRDEPLIQIVHAWWEDLHGERREQAGGSAAAFVPARVPAAAIGEAIERRAWANTHEQGPMSFRAGALVSSGSEQVVVESATMRSTNGWACGLDQQDARGRAAAEVIERHLYSLLYCGELNGRPVRSGRCAEHTRWLDRYRLDLQVHRIDAGDDLPLAVSIAYVFDQTTGGPQATIGLGCSMSAEKASDKAILEALKVRMWAHQVKDRVRRAPDDVPIDPVEARLLRVTSPAGAEALRSFLSDRTGPADDLTNSDRKPSEPTALIDGAAHAAASLGIELLAVDRGPLTALDLRPVAWVVGRGARFVNDEPSDPAAALEVPLV